MKEKLSKWREDLGILFYCPIVLLLTSFIAIVMALLEWPVTRESFSVSRVLIVQLPLACVICLVFAVFEKYWKIMLLFCLGVVGITSLLTVLQVLLSGPVNREVFSIGRAFLFQLPLAVIICLIMAAVKITHSKTKAKKRDSYSYGKGRRKH